MHHRCKKVNVKTCCHEEKCSLSLSWGCLTRWKLSRAATEIDSCCLSLMSCGCWCWQDETEKALPANAVSPVLPLPHPQKSLKVQLWDQWYDLCGKMLKVNFKGTMMDFFFFFMLLTAQSCWWISFSSLQSVVDCSSQHWSIKLQIEANWYISCMVHDNIAVKMHAKLQIRGEKDTAEWHHLFLAIRTDSAICWRLVRSLLCGGCCGCACGRSVWLHMWGKTLTSGAKKEFMKQLLKDYR